jgi:hypothetical protein
VTADFIEFRRRGNWGTKMAGQAQAVTRHDLEAKIVRRCWEDESFRKEFTADPAGAFVKYLEVPAASLPRITVHQEEQRSWHIILPAKPASMAELSEEDLAKVAGGGTPVAVSILATLSAFTSASSVSATVSAAITLDKGW